MLKKRIICQTIIITAILLFQFIGGLPAVSADDIPTGGTPPETNVSVPSEPVTSNEVVNAPSDPIEVEEVLPQSSESAPTDGAIIDPSTLDSASLETPIAPLASGPADVIQPIVDSLDAANAVLSDGNSDPLPLASQQTADLLAGDPFFSDPVDPTIVRAYLTDCTGWTPPAGYTSGTCTETASPVQDAVDAATSGTTIYIANGHYGETVSIATANLSLVGLGGDVTIDQLRLFADLNDSTQNVYSPYIDVYHGGNISDALNLRSPGGQIFVHGNSKQKDIQYFEVTSTLPVQMEDIDTIQVTGGETVNYSCTVPSILLLPSGNSAESTNILCGYTGSFSQVTTENLPGTLDPKYHFVDGVSLVLRNSGNPVLALTGLSRIEIQFVLSANVDPTMVSIMGWDQNLNNGTGAWVTMGGLNVLDRIASIQVNSPGYFVLVVS